MNPKLDVGRTFERIFQIYGSQFSLLIPAALVLFLPVAIINGFLYDEGGFFLSIIASAVALVATYWYQGMVIEAARDILDGRRDHTIGSLFSSAGPFVPNLIVAGLLAGFAIAIGLILLLVPGLYLITIWAVIVPVIVLERVGVFESFGRSRRLVKGNGWQVFGVLLLLFVATFVVRLVVGAIIGGIFDSFIGFAIAELIVSVLMVPLTALAAAVIYFELKGLNGEEIPGVTGDLVGAGAAAPAAGSGTPGGAAPGPEAPGTPGGGTPGGGTPGSDMPPPPPPGSGQTPAPSPGAPPPAAPPAAPPPGGAPAPGGDPQPPSGGPQAPPNA